MPEPFLSLVELHRISNRGFPGWSPGVVSKVKRNSAINVSRFELDLPIRGPSRSNNAVLLSLSMHRRSGRAPQGWPHVDLYLAIVLNVMRGRQHIWLARSLEQCFAKWPRIAFPRGLYFCLEIFTFSAGLYVRRIPTLHPSANSTSSFNLTSLNGVVMNTPSSLRARC